ncbi:hypothetical protein GPA25_16035 [Aromatoleum diolicum]|uniref:Uncharacterized protein n=2 Tax=Aromatoleum diolicum TaxID=75796 RepID=A0ABX1QGW5_9RHOO|nr:hypothetical protein [Aromatoleum diolicum]NMG76270.1 hypothetical protein [Aromatoleum diolicum]
MSPRPLIVCFVMLLAGGVGAQPAPSGAATAATAEGAGKPVESFRDTTGYRYPALSRTVRDMQNLAYALQLRDYCADERVSDEFVKAQLASFSRITGRTESCRTLLAY